MKTLKKKLLSIMFVMVLAVSGIITAGCSIAAASGTSAKTGDMMVHFLDVGQGLSIFVQSKGQTLLYDGGDRNSASFVVSYLKEQKVKRIDYLISSHYDEDHISGLIGCLNAFPSRRVIGADYVHDSGLYRSFMESVENQGLKVLHPEVGEDFPLVQESLQSCLRMKSGKMTAM